MHIFEGYTRLFNLIGRPDNDVGRAFCGLSDVLNAAMVAGIVMIVAIAPYVVTSSYSSPMYITTSYSSPSRIDDTPSYAYTPSYPTLAPNGEYAHSAYGPCTLEEWEVEAGITCSYHYKVFHPGR